MIIMGGKKTGRSRRKLYFSIFHWLLLCIALVLIVRHNLQEPEVRIKRHPTKEEIKTVISGSIENYLVHAPIDHTALVLTYDGHPVKGACVATAELPPRIKGYVDEINTMVVIDKTGTIRGVKLLAHRETPPYMRKVLRSGFLEKFVGKKINSPLREIDSVTGASITADAIKEDVVQASHLAAAEIFGLDIKTVTVPGWSAAITSPAFITVFIALLVSLYARFGKRPPKGKREISWSLSIALIGVYAMTPFTLVHLFQLLELSVPGPANALVLLLAAYVLITTIFFGPLWCSYACPFGALQEFVFKIPLKKWKISPGLMTYAREIRTIVLFVAVLGFFGLGVNAFAMVEPRGHLFARTDMAVLWIFIAVVLLASMFVKRFWCRFFCPTGACLVLLSSHRKYLKGVGKGVDESGIDSPDKDAEADESENTEKKHGD